MALTLRSENMAIISEEYIYIYITFVSKIMSGIVPKDTSDALMIPNLVYRFKKQYKSSPCFDI